MEKSVWPALIEETVNRSIELPNNPFAGAWSGFTFLEAEIFFTKGGLAEVKSLMRLSACLTACIENIDERLPFPERSFLIDEATDEMHYLQFAAYNGLMKGNRFAIVAESAEWCIFCQPLDNVAVAAIKREKLISDVGPWLRRLNAVLPEDMRKSFEGLPYPFNSLVTKWREGLLENFSR